MDLIGLLVVLVIFCLVYWGANRLMSGFGVEEPVRAIVIVVLVVIFVLWVLGKVGGGRFF